MCLCVVCGGDSKVQHLRKYVEDILGVCKSMKVSALLFILLPMSLSGFLRGVSVKVKQ